MCKANTSIACGTFNDSTARLQRTAGFGGQNDGLGGAVLDGTTGVQEFSFPENVAAGFFADAAEAYERGVANRINEAVMVVQDIRQGCKSGLVSYSEYYPRSHPIVPCIPHQASNHRLFAGSLCGDVSAIIAHRKLNDEKQV